MHLGSRYGSLQRELLDLERDQPALKAPLVPGLPYHRSEAIYAVRSEMATTLDDVLSRRTRARLLGRDATAAAAQSVAELIAPELGWNAARIATEVASYRAALDLEREFGLVGGDIFHGKMGLDQLFSNRPMLGHADYRMPLPGLYLCGAGAHPGGGVTGAPGHNAARAVLADRRRLKL